jgi:hypothetical protein
MSDYPSSEEYVRAVQDPASAFRAVLLKTAVFELHPRWQIPVPASGNAAVVFKASVQGSDRALRFFVREDVSDRERYTALSSHIAQRGLDDCVAAAQWRDDAITVRGRTWPMIEMQWVNGRTLEAYVEYLVAAGNTSALTTLAERWRAMIARLQAAEFAHGDLQHGNVLIDDTSAFRLVDLDGCWIAPFQGKIPPNEAGHPNYQHPKRVWGRGMDTFPGLVIYTALLALSKKPALWATLHDGEDTLFKAPDFTAPGATEVWRELAAVNDPRLEVALHQLKLRCETNEPSTDTLEAVLDGTQQTSTAPTDTARQVVSTPWWERTRTTSAATQAEPESPTTVLPLRQSTETPLPPPPPRTTVPPQGRTPRTPVESRPTNPWWPPNHAPKGPGRPITPPAKQPAPWTRKKIDAAYLRSAGIAVFTIIVLAIVIIVLSSTKHPSPEPTPQSIPILTPTHTPTYTPLPPTFSGPAGLSPAERQLWQVLPMGGVNSASCQSYGLGEEMDGVQASLRCPITDSSMGQPIIYYQFTDDTATQNYLQLRAQAITQTGDCSQGGEQETTWSNLASQKKGRLVCVENPNDGTTYFKMIWADGSTGLVAVIQEPAASTVLSWWTHNADKQFQ